MRDEPLPEGAAPAEPDLASELWRLARACLRLTARSTAWMARAVERLCDRMTPAA